MCKHKNESKPFKKNVNRACIHSNSVFFFSVSGHLWYQSMNGISSLMEVIDKVLSENCKTATGFFGLCTKHIYFRD